MTAALPELLILRHGETEWNRAGRMQGALDSPLTDRGRAQAAAQRAILHRHGVLGGQGGHAIITSPQGRALATARIIAQGTTAGRPRTDARLREIGMGRWTGRARADLAAIHPEFFAAQAPPLGYYDHAPGGEGLGPLAARLRGFLSGLRGPAVIVTHGITSRVLRCLALGLPIADFGRLDGGQGVVYRISGRRYEKLTEDAVIPQPCPGAAGLARPGAIV